MCNAACCPKDNTVTGFFKLAGFDAFTTSLPETKKSRPTGSRSRGEVQEDDEQVQEESGGPFVVMLRAAGVTLGQAGTANQIGKHGAPTEGVQIVKLKVRNHVYAVLSLFSSCRPGRLSEETPAEAAEKPTVPGGEWRV